MLKKIVICIRPIPPPPPHTHLNHQNKINFVKALHFTNYDRIATPNVTPIVLYISIIRPILLISLGILSESMIVYPNQDKA